MASIRTVTGDIAPEELGICYPHEHVLAAPPEPYAAQEPDLVLDDMDAARESLEALRAAGGAALVEMTPIDYNRRPADLATLSAQTGVHIICVTGYLKEKFCKPLVDRLTTVEIAERMIRDICAGIDQTGVRAGVIKASSSLNVITATEHKVFLAAARAHHATGALISTHTEVGTMALEQIALLQEQGVKSSRILIGHLDRRLDWDYHLTIARTGVYMGFDQVGKTQYAPDEQRADFIRRLTLEGHGAQIMISRDLARKRYFPAYGVQAAPGFPFLLTSFVPLLRQAGMAETDITMILADNPARALALMPVN